MEQVVFLLNEYWRINLKYLKIDYLLQLHLKLMVRKCFVMKGSIFVAGSAIQWLRDNLNFLKTHQKLISCMKKQIKMRVCILYLL